MNASQSTKSTTDATTNSDTTDDSTTAAPTETLPDDVRSAEAKLVYLYVRQRGACTAEELVDALRLKKLSLFPHLRTLLEKDLLNREGTQYVVAGSGEASRTAEAAD